MHNGLPCPEVQELRQFLLGRTPDPDAQRFEQHLERCGPCRDALQTVQAEDTLVLAMRGLAQGLPEPDDDRLRGQIDRLCRLRPLWLLVDPTGAEPAASGAEIKWDFLAPAQGPDELGRLGPYRVLKVLGAGGMGIVFLAEDTHLQRRVALKALRPGLPASEAARQRFFREARAMAALNHDHIATIHQVGEDRGVPFLAMEFLEGELLEERIKREGQLNVAEVLRIGREIAEGLAAAHARGLVHRDIKPTNILLAQAHGRQPDGSVKILDFGLARPMAADAQITHNGLIIGTPAYMAPEQARGEATDGRADLFSLGCVLYRMAAGRLPWQAKDAVSTLLAVAGKEPPPLRELNPALPPALADLVTRLLAKYPEARPATAAVVVEELRRLEDQHAAAPAAPPPAVPVLPAAARPRGARRGPVRLVAALLLGLAVLGAAGVIYVQTDAGLLKIETEDDAVQVIVEQGGKVVKTIDRTSGTEVVLHSGEYRLRLGAKQEGVKLSTDSIQIMRGAMAVVRITRAGDVPGPAVANNRGIGSEPRPARSPIEDEWFQRVRTFMPARQVKAVLAKLEQRNLGFDGRTARAVIRNDTTVVELHVVGYYLSDLSPVRALHDLERFSCNRPAHWHNQLTDLSPLRGLRLRGLSCRGTAVRDLTPLAGMPLRSLDVGFTQVADLQPLREMWQRHGLALHELWIDGTPVTDAAPLQGMPLKELHCDAALLRGSKLLRSLPSLEFINGLPAGLAEEAPERE